MGGPRRPALFGERDAFAGLLSVAGSPMALTLKYFPAIFWQGKGLMNLGTGFAQA